MRRLIIVTSALLIASSAFAQPARRDGNWWNDQDRNYKLGYAAGLFDGLDLGRDFATWGLAPKDPCIVNSLESTEKYIAGFVAEATAGQLVDGLDDFYKDYRNRTIMADRAVWLVLNGVAGTPAAKLQEMIESHRRSAK
jgi:hypothetical protein